MRAFLLTCVSLIACVCLMCNFADAQALPIKFAAPVQYPAGSVFVAVGDLNGDGRLDIVTADWGDGLVTVMLGNGDGTFQAPVSYGAGGGTSHSIAIADVNKDGKPDLVVANTYSNSIGVLLGNGDGTFQTAVTYSSGGTYPYSVAVGDVNGDGKPDLVVANFGVGTSDGSIAILLGNGDGTFQAASSFDSGAAETNFVALGDLNGDGKLDLALTSNRAGKVSVFLGRGDGTFQSSAVYDFPDAYSAAIGDLNGDGHPDLVVGSTNGDTTVGVLLGNGDGTFQAPVIYDSGGFGAWSVAIADLNGDGKADVAVANACMTVRCPGFGEVGVLLGNGDGTFRGPARLNTGGQLGYSIAVGDFNGDGKPDLAVMNSDSFSTAIVLNATSVTSKTTLTSSPNPASVSQPVSFTATITSVLPIPNGELVGFYVGNTKLGEAPTSQGVATLTLSFSSVAKDVIVEARYPGDAYHKPSTKAVKQVVVAAP